MRRRVLTVGLLLLFAGLIVVQQGSRTIVPVAESVGLTSQTQIDRVVIAPALVAVSASNYTFLSADLESGTEVKGSVQVVGEREVAFYVMNEGNFSMWRRGGGPTTVIVATPVVRSYNFTFPVRSTGAYYFVFDNQDAARRTLIFDLSVIEHQTVLHPLAAFAGYELLVVGVVIAIVGMRTGRKSATESKTESVPVIEESARCTFCGAELGIDRVFCGKCGRAQK